VTAIRENDVLDLPKTQEGSAVVVVETPRGSGNKLTYDPKLGAFKLDRVLPAGMTFPFDFGFLPQTLAEDGDPLDVIVLLDSPAYPGCIVPARLIGTIEARQKDAGTTDWQQNDRLLAVAEASRAHRSVRSVRDLDPFIVESIGAFFADYHRLDGDAFEVTGNGGVRAAERAVRDANAAYRERRNGAAPASNDR
jgi:inorganic pyrophosphatase